MLVVCLSISCGDDGQMIKPDAIDHTLGEASQLALSCADAAGDIYTLPAGLPAMDDSRRGDVVRCAVTEKLTVPEIQAQIDAYNVNYPRATAGEVKSGFWTYRFVYRTTRATTVTATRPGGESAAVLLLPARPLAGAPLVVWGHGSVGIASKCAPSRLDLTAPSQDQDFPPMLYRLAAYGFTVVAPDYAGFSFDQPPGYFNAEDEAHSVLDATRAAAKLLPSAPNSVVFVGHSQGGHAMLAAHSYAKSYGMAGTLVGVAVLAPFWNSFSLWAAATTNIAGLKTATDVNSILYAMEYAYSAGELRDPGHGVDVFQTAKQQDAKDTILGGECYDAPKLQALGAMPSDFFVDTYVNTVGFTCAASPFAAPDCSDPEAAKWRARWIEDRPPIDTQGPPILMMFGGMDTFVNAGRAQCARDKLTRDLAAGGTTQVTYCSDSTAAHRDIVRGINVEYVTKWVASRTGAEPDPGTCAAMTPSTCSVPPQDH